MIFKICMADGTFLVASVAIKWREYRHRTSAWAQRSYELLVNNVLVPACWTERVEDTPPWCIPEVVACVDDVIAQSAMPITRSRLFRFRAEGQLREVGIKHERDVCHILVDGVLQKSQSHGDRHTWTAGGQRMIFKVCVADGSFLEASVAITRREIRHRTSALAEWSYELFVNNVIVPTCWTQRVEDTPPLCIPEVVAIVDIDSFHAETMGSDAVDIDLFVDFVDTQKGRQTDIRTDKQSAMPIARSLVGNPPSRLFRFRTDGQLREVGIKHEREACHIFLDGALQTSQSHADRHARTAKGTRMIFKICMADGTFLVASVAIKWREYRHRTSAWAQRSYELLVNNVLVPACWTERVEDTPPWCIPEVVACVDDVIAQSAMPITRSRLFRFRAEGQLREVGIKHERDVCHILVDGVLQKSQSHGDRHTWTAGGQRMIFKVCVADGSFLEASVAITRREIRHRTSAWAQWSYELFVNNVLVPACRTERVEDTSPLCIPEVVAIVDMDSFHEMTSPLDL